jgi:hypothetical protein
MSDDVVTKLLPAIEIAAFRRARDGSFSAIAPPPRWFGRLVADATFPFLGHILEEASLFWQHGTPGSREWGPCVEVNDVGREFHYRVLAVTVDHSQFLLFQLDPGSDRMREVLQRVREQALTNPASDAQATLSKVQQEVRRTSDRVHELLRPLLGSGLRDAQFELWKTLSTICDDLVHEVDALVGSPGPASDTRMERKAP